MAAIESFAWSLLEPRATSWFTDEVSCQADGHVPAVIERSEEHTSNCLNDDYIYTSFRESYKSAEELGYPGLMDQVNELWAPTSRGAENTDTDNILQELFQSARERIEFERNDAKQGVPVDSSESDALLQELQQDVSISMPSPDILWDNQFAALFLDYMSEDTPDATLNESSFYSGPNELASLFEDLGTQFGFNSDSTISLCPKEPKEGAPLSTDEKCQTAEKLQCPKTPPPSKSEIIPQMFFYPPIDGPCDPCFDQPKNQSPGPFQKEVLDIPFGRGGCHHDNRMKTQLLNDSRNHGLSAKYRASSNHTKQEMVREIIRQAHRMGARFISRNEHDGHWYLATHKKIHEKVRSILNSPYDKQRGMIKRQRLRQEKEKAKLLKVGGNKGGATVPRA